MCELQQSKQMGDLKGIILVADLFHIRYKIWHIKTSNTVTFTVTESNLLLGKQAYSDAAA